MSTWTHQRARVASLSRSRTPDDPELLDARRGLKAARLAARIHLELGLVDDADRWAEHIVSSLPPLTPAEAVALGKLAAALTAARAPGDEAVWS